METVALCIHSGDACCTFEECPMFKECFPKLSEEEREKLYQEQLKLLKSIKK